MAKSKNGGTRSYIRGRIGSDVYSIGKNGKGERQQVVRSLAEDVANPRTQPQMFNRMIMSTVMQAVSAFSPIIDHSFDGIAKGQPSISEFIRRNYALVKADAVAHPSSGNKFGLNMYQEKGCKVGQFVLSNGTVVIPTALAINGGQVAIYPGAGNMTVGGLKAALGLSADGYITVCWIKNNGFVGYVRLYLSTTLPDSTAITAANVGTLFTQEGNTTLTVAFESSDIMLLDLSQETEAVAYGAIISERIDGAWQHSASTLKVVETPDFNSDTALLTYPVGTEQFLNGGDI